VVAVKADYPQPPLADRWELPPAEGRRRDRSYRLEWHPDREVVKRALFQLDGDDASLQHIRTVRVSQGGTTAATDPDATLGDIPVALLALMRYHGVTPIEGGQT
jgi:hypothetical protein